MAGQKGGGVSFGAFEINFNTRELRRDGIKVKLQNQSFAVLALLLESPGELVTRDEFRQRIWGAETYVDFDQGLNKAIKNIRAALNDSAEQPVYVETLPRRGYRFTATLDSRPQSEAGPPEPAPVDRGRRPWFKPALLIVAVLTAGSALLYFLARSNVRPERELRLRPLTTNSSENFVQESVISPDGRSLLFGDQLGIHLRVLATGETHTIKRPAAVSDRAAWYPTSWFPDQTHFLAVSESLTSEGVVPTTWTVSVLGDGARKLRERALDSAVSPDGSLIAFTSGGVFSNLEIWVMGANGEDARALSRAKPGTVVCCTAWAPEGHRIFNMTAHWPDPSEYSLDSIESRDSRGGPASTIVSHATHFGDPWPTIGGFTVLADGRLLYSQRGSDASPSGSDDSNLWERRIRLDTGKTLGESRRLTRWFGKDGLGNFSTSRDGNRFVLQKDSSQFHTYLGEVDGSGPVGLLRRLAWEDSNEYPFAWTADSKAVFFTSDRAGFHRLYKQPINETLAEMVNTEPGVVGGARLSPDGQWIIYPIWSADGSRTRLMRISLSGGAPQLIRELNRVEDVGCSLMPKAFCATVENQPGQQVVSSFDVVTGQTQTLFKASRHENDSGIVLDGAIGSFREDSAGARVSLFSTAGKVEREISLAPWRRLNGLDWSADKSVFYTTSTGPGGTTILRVHASGRIDPLWYMRGSKSGWAIPAPDGRHLVVSGTSTNSNAWLVENF